MIENDDVHCMLVNELISEMNDYLSLGYGADFIASAAVAAAAAFSTFNLSYGHALPVDRVAIGRVAKTFASRMEDSWGSKGRFGGKGGEPV